MSLTHGRKRKKKYDRSPKSPTLSAPGCTRKPFLWSGGWEKMGGGVTFEIDPSLPHWGSITTPCHCSASHLGFHSSSPKSLERSPAWWWTEPADGQAWRGPSMFWGHCVLWSGTKIEVENSSIHVVGREIKQGNSLVRVMLVVFLQGVPNRQLSFISESGKHLYLPLMLPWFRNHLSRIFFY